MALDKSTIDGLKAKNPSRDLAALELAEGDFVIASAPAAEYARFRSADGPAERFESMRVLVGISTLHPDAAALDALLARYPGLVDTLGGEIVELSGARAKVARRKL